MQDDPETPEEGQEVPPDEGAKSKSKKAAYFNHMGMDGEAVKRFKEIAVQWDHTVAKEAKERVQSLCNLDMLSNFKHPSLIILLQQLQSAPPSLNVKDEIGIIEQALGIKH